MIQIFARESNDEKEQQAEQREAVRQFLARAREQFQIASEAESTQRKEMLEDDQFRIGDMWPDEIRKAREAKEKPCLTIDQISGPIKQVTGEERQAKPSLHMAPRGEGASRQTAEDFEDLARAIQTDSHAEIAYDWAFEKAVTIGLGWYRYLTEYESDESFDQVIKIAWIENALAVYDDPATMDYHRRDRRFLFVKSWIPKDEFVPKYGQEAFASLEEFASIGDHAPEWFSTERGCAVAEYWYVDYDEADIAELVTGKVIDVTALDDQQRAALPIATLDGEPMIRRVLKRRVKWALISATAVLEGNATKTAGRAWPGKWIPFVAVEGERLHVDGKRIFRGIIRTARDPQKMYNVLVSTGMETLALMPRAAYVAAAGQVEAYKEMWENANTESYGVLPYDPVDVGGHPVAPPQRQIVDAPLQAIFASIRQAAMDLRSVTGFYDASDPNRPNSEQSGRAISQRAQQGAIAHVNFIDNLQRALSFGGEILIDLAPKIYDRPGRLVQVLGLDEAPALAQIGDPDTPAPQGPGFMGRLADRFRTFIGRPQAAGAAGPKGPRTLQLQGPHAVIATVGSSYTTKREQIVAQLTELFKAYPPLAAVGMDVLLDNMEGPGMKQLAERVRKTLPPGIAEDADTDEIPPQAQAQLAQQQQAIQMLTAQLQQAIETIKGKRLELLSRERVAMMQTQATVAVAMAKLGSETDRAALDREFQRFTQQVDLLHEMTMAEAAQSGDALLTGAGQAHDLAMAHVNHGNAMQAVAAQPTPQPGGGGEARA